MMILIFLFIAYVLISSFAFALFVYTSIVCDGGLTIDDFWGLLGIAWVPVLNLVMLAAAIATIRDRKL